MVSDESESDGSKERPLKAARFNPDVASQIEAYADDREVTESEALRELVEKGFNSDSTTLRRDLADVAVAFTGGLFAASLVLSYGLETVALALLAALLTATVTAALKFGRYDIQITLINRERSENGGYISDSTLTFDTQNPQPGPGPLKAENDENS